MSSSGIYSTGEQVLDGPDEAKDSIPRRVALPNSDGIGRRLVGCNDVVNRGHRSKNTGLLRILKENCKPFLMVSNSENSSKGKIHDSFLFLPSSKFSRLLRTTEYGNPGTTTSSGVYCFAQPSNVHCHNSFLIKSQIFV